MPRSWAKKQGLKKGDEIDIKVKDNALLIRPANASRLKRTLDLDNKEKYLDHILYALYRKGYYEIKLTFSKLSIPQKVQKILHEETIGFEVVEQGDNYLIIKVVAGALPSEFNTVFKRSFNLLISLYQGIIDVLKTGNILKIKSLVYLSKDNIKYISFCKRLINKGEIEREDLIREYSSIQKIENLNICFNELSYECLKLPNEIKKLKPELLKLFIRSYELLNESYDVFEDYNLIKALKVFDKIQALRGDINDFVRNYSGIQLRFTHCLINITKEMFFLVRAKLGMEI